MSAQHNRFSLRTPHVIEQAGDGPERHIDAHYRQFIDDHVYQALSGGPVSYDPHDRGPRIGQRRTFTAKRSYDGHS